MTIDATTPIQTHTIAGTGPYGTTWPYAEGTIRPGIVQEDGVVTFLAGADYTVDPLSSATSGNVFLTPAVAAANAGRTLYLERDTPEEQGWIGNLSARERGLEAQLDQIVMSQQEFSSGLARSLRATVALAPFVPGAIGTTLIRTATGYAAGPTADQIAGAQADAAAAAISAAQALAAQAAAEAAAGNWDWPSFAALDAAYLDGFVPVQGKTYTVAGLKFLGINILTTIVTGLPGLQPIDATPQHFRADITGATDCQPQCQAWANWIAGKGAFELPAGLYRWNTPLTLPKNCTIRGTSAAYQGSGTQQGTVILQYGDRAVQGPNDLVNLNLYGIQFIYMKSASPGTFDAAISLKAHVNCRFEDFNFYFYNDVTLMERLPDAADTLTTFNNEYNFWYAPACAHWDISIGHEKYYTRHQGNGVQTVFSTGQVWPEQFDSSVVILRENQFRYFSELALTTDYTVSYPGGICTVTLTAPLPANHRIHIWTAAVTSTDRRPISNNTFREFGSEYLFRGGHTWVRWVDNETLFSELPILAKDFAHYVMTNPYLRRTGQGGDYAVIFGSTVAYVLAPGFVTDFMTLRGHDFGPGTHSVRGYGVSMDLAWEPPGGGTNVSVLLRDLSRVALTGTVATTAGSPVVTGTGTQFRRELTLVADVNELKDRIEIGGAVYQIASIDSATQITLASNAAATLAGQTAHRRCLANGADYQIDFPSIGTIFANDRLGMGGEAKSPNASHQWGLATIPAGQTSVVVNHPSLRRTPRLHEIRVTPGTGTGPGTLFSINPINPSSFQINVSPAAAANQTWGWDVELKDLN